MSALDQPAHPLWVFIDESGNFDFSERGTRHFLMTAVATDDPGASAAHLLRLKYEQMLRGSNQLDFHAVHNSHGTRRRVYSILDELELLRAHTFIADKRLLPVELHNGAELMALVASRLIGCLISKVTGCDAIVVVLDTALPARAQGAVKQALKASLQSAGLPYRIHFHRVANEPNGQIAAYIAWADFRLGERNAASYINLLEKLGPSRHFITTE